MGKKNLQGSNDINYDELFKNLNLSNGKIKEGYSDNLFNKTETTRVDFDSTNRDYINEYDNPFTSQFINPNEEDPFLDVRAQRQGFWDTMGKGLGRAANKAGAEVLKLAPTLAGIGAGAVGQVGDLISGEDNTDFIETAFNNSWIKSIDKGSEAINDSLLPVYVRKAVRDGNFWDKITNSEMWATDGADGLGYFLSALVPGKILSSIGVGSRLMSMGAKSANLAQYSGRMSKVVDGIGKLGITADRLDNLSIGVVNSVLEAGAGSAQLTNTLNRELENPESAMYKRKQQMIMSKNTELDNMRQQGLIDDYEYNNLSQNVESEVNNTLKNEISDAASKNFTHSFLTTLGPEIMMSKMLFGKKGADKLVKETAGFKTQGKHALKQFGKGFVSEGAEEVSQTVGETKYGNQVRQGTISKTGFVENMSTLGSDFIETLGTTEGQMAGFLGGIMGGPATAVTGYFQKGGDIKKTNDLMSYAENAVNDYHQIKTLSPYKMKEVITEIPQEPKYVTRVDEQTGETIKDEIKQPSKTKKDFVYELDENGNKVLDDDAVFKIKKSLDMTEQRSNEFDKAIEEKDFDKVEEFQKQAETVLLSKFVTADEMGLDALQQYLKELYPSQVKEDEGDENSPLQYSKENEKQVTELMEKAKFLNKQNNLFKDLSKRLINLEENDFSEAELEGTYSQLQNLYLNLKANQYDVQKKRESLHSQRDELIKESGRYLDETVKNENFVDGKSEDIYENVKVLNPAIKHLDVLIANLDGKLNEIHKLTDSDIWDSKKVNELVKSKIEEGRGNLKKLENVEDLQKSADEIGAAKEIEDLDSVDTQNSDYLKKLLNEKRTILQEKRDIENAEKLEARRVEKETELELQNSKNEDLINIAKTKNTETSNHFTDYEFVSSTPSSITLKKDNVEETFPIVEEEASANVVEVKDDSVDPEQISKNNFKLPSKSISDSFRNYMMKMVNKVGTVVGFKVNTYSSSNITEQSKKAIKEYDDFVGGNITNKPLNKDLLYRWLPISFTIDGVETWSLFPGDNDSGYGSTTPDAKCNTTFSIRTKIIDLIGQGYKLEEIISEISNQNSGDYNTDANNSDGSIVKNSVLDLNFVNNDLGGDLSKLGLYHINEFGELTAVTGAAVNDFSPTIKNHLTNQLGQIFLAIKNVKGISVPVRLNNQKISQNQATGLFEIFKTLLSDTNEGLLTSSELSRFPELIPKIQQYLQPELDLLKNNGEVEDILIKDILDLLLSKNTSRNKNVQIVEDPVSDTGFSLRIGDTLYNANFFDYQKNDVINHLRERVQNISTVGHPFLNFKNQNYLKYLFENKILSTNLNIENHFKVEDSQIWVSDNVKPAKVKPIKSDVKSTQQPTTVNQSDIDAKKTGIENTLKIGNNNAKLSHSDLKIIDYTPSNITEDKYFVKTISGNYFEVHNKKFGYSENVLEISKEKYDTELAALGNQQSVTPQQPTQQTPNALDELKSIYDGYLQELEKSGEESIVKPLLGINPTTGEIKTLKPNVVISKANIMGMPWVGFYQTNEKAFNQFQNSQPKVEPEPVVDVKSEHELIGKEIEAKEPTTKELIKGKVVFVEINKIKKGQFRITLDNNEIVAWNEVNPDNFTWVKKNSSENIRKSDNNSVSLQDEIKGTPENKHVESVKDKINKDMVEEYKVTQKDIDEFDRVKEQEISKRENVRQKAKEILSGYTTEKREAYNKHCKN